MEGSFSISAFQSLKREKWSNKLLYHNLKKKLDNFNCFVELRFKFLFIEK